jgi:hypothetical protein
VEGTRVIGGAGIDAIEHDAVKVGCEVQRGAKALNEGDRAAVPTPHTQVLTGAAALVCEQSAEKGAQHLARESCVPRAAIAQGVRKSQDPLAHGNRWKHALYEVSGCIGHPPPTTGRAEPPPLAREGDETIMAASVAVDPQEAVGEHTTGEVGPQLALDEAGDWRPPLSRVGEEALEVVTDDSVKQGCFGVVALILDGRPSRDRVVARNPSKFDAVSQRSVEPPLSGPLRAARCFLASQVLSK